MLNHLRNPCIRCSSNSFISSYYLAQHYVFYQEFNSEHHLYVLLFACKCLHISDFSVNGTFILEGKHKNIDICQLITFCNVTFTIYFFFFFVCGPIKKVSLWTNVC